MYSLTKRCWAEISLGSIEHNYKTIRATLPEGCRFLGVVKANAYGHGAVEVSRLLVRLGCEYLAVASFDEAVHLRDAGITAPILILGWTAPEYICILSDMGVTQTVANIDTALEYASVLKENGKRLSIHIKLDTGMGRLGFNTQDGELLSHLERLFSCGCFDAEGIFTHFAVSDEPDDPFTALQFERFMTAADTIESRFCHKFTLRHCANSGAVINYPQYALDMVRPGIALYGYHPAGEGERLDLRPSMALKARIAAVNRHTAGDSISYGRCYTASDDMLTAVASIGYADGLHRSLSGSFDAVINGHTAPQIGRICMDMCMFNVTGIPGCKAGDEVTIFGAVTHDLDRLAAKCGTISYELLCSVSDRVPRVYID